MPGVLNKVLYEEDSPRGPTRYPFIYLISRGFRESSFNMTRGGGGGDEDIETRSLKF